MGITVTLTDLDNLTNQTSAVAAINSNSAAIVAGFEDALNVSGDTMLGDLDMNSKQIYNLPTPSSTSSPLRLLDVQLLNGDGTIEAYPLPAGGTSGQVLTKVDSTNYNVEWSPAPSIAGGSTGELGVYTSSTSIGGDANANISNGALTLGQAGSVQGSLTLAGGTSGSSTIAFPATTTGTITFPTGITNFTTTGGTSQVLQQTSEGAAITVGQLAASALSNGTTGTGAVVLETAPTITGSVTGNPIFTQNVGFGNDTNPQAPVTLSSNTSASAGYSWSAGTQFGILMPDTTPGGIEIDEYGSIGELSFRRAAGTAASPSNILSGDLIGAVRVLPYVNGAFTTSSTAETAFFYNDSSPNYGTQIRLFATPAGSTTKAVQMTIGAGVNIGTSTTDPGAGNLTVAGIITPTGGITTSLGTPSGRVFSTGNQPQTSATGPGSSVAIAATTDMYWCEIWVPITFSSTGVSIFNYATATGNLNLYLSSTAGTEIAHTAATAQSGTSAYQKIAWASGPITILGPATYYVGLQSTSTSSTIGCHVVGNFGCAIQTGTTNGTFPTPSLPTTFTTLTGPVATLY